MRAYRLLEPQQEPEFQDVPDPHAGPGQVVVKVAGSGLCHTDLIVKSRDRAYWNDNPSALKWLGVLDVAYTEKGL